MIYITASDAPVYVTTEEDGTVVVTTEDPSPSQVAITFEDEGVALGTRGTVNEVDLVGSGVSGVRVGNKVTYTISSGGGSGDVTGPASSTTDNIATYADTSGDVIKDGGSKISDLVPTSRTVNGLALTGNITVPHGATLYYHSDAAASVALTNQSSSEAFFTQNNNRSVHKFNATNYTHVRIVVNVIGLSASVNSPRLYPKYITTNDASIANFTTIGTGLTTEAASLAAVDIVASDWIALPAGAKADVFFAVAQNGGDGAADPATGSVSLQFKRE